MCMYYLGGRFPFQMFSGICSFTPEQMKMTIYFIILHNHQHTSAQRETKTNDAFLCGERAPPRCLSSVHACTVCAHDARGYVCVCAAT